MLVLAHIHKNQGVVFSPVQQKCLEKIVEDEKLVGVLIKLAVASDKHPMSILFDVCEVLSGGDDAAARIMYNETFNNVRKILYARRHTLPWVIQSPE